MSLTDIEATWHVDGDAVAPECAYDPELHTGPRDRIETAEERAAREAVAREVCEDCPARLFCTTYTLAVRPTSGVWAGMTAADIAGESAGLRVVA
ncbi:WhiB family transcriptional regulator [Microbispora sp. NPDC049125]|uniref:WhiB family transcriptional regulator n=1 Tax=Microbispora sp. NPDC049125 TaxID=3154929 RepID=UPI003467973A